MENVASQKLIFRESRCTDEEATAKLWAKRLTAYHRLHLKHPSVRESGKAAKTNNLKNNLNKEQNNDRDKLLKIPKMVVNKRGGGGLSKTDSSLYRT